ncbi:2-succinyl-6-hydroxy-2,4-cyclohexadiene-1-carboxylate synthase [Halobacillus sp. A5]|uniref:2-succinyl-6-hydroxy-2, 4-cyclohexadiene-1-carboxylate synthase n=1 Tax=Halobacillus sp. A5 TaxID=2880263 RepID=UPI0020A69D6C|nr:2-succinyl-6-hydroxy-2,4-cyclohexadiene-1-carboxylate synthase [Halobacillus sp. A5]MCP3028300.1 2-succinyl-6-hydroxy-2,4-cyclohexadiene-1-carboxylate synthase [Halobacillus sp. A5]
MFLKTDHRKYWVEDTGTGDPIFLLHGFTGSTKSFDRLITDLSSSFRLISIEMPGHGRTGEVGVISMEEFSQDLKQLIEHFSYSKVNLLGYSMGGRAALSFAMLQPQYVNKLVLESSSPGLELQQERAARKSADQKLIEMLLYQGIETFVEYWERIPLFDSHKKLPEHDRLILRDERLRHNVRGLAQSLEGMGTGQQPSWWQQLSSLKKRVLLITGENDEKFVKINNRMSELLPICELFVVKGAGHTIHVEDPGTFNEIVEDFML